MCRQCGYCTGEKGDISKGQDGKVIEMSHEYRDITKVPITLYKIKDKEGEIHRGILKGHFSSPTLGDVVEMQLNKDKASMIILEQGKIVQWFDIEKIVVT